MAMFGKGLEKLLEGGGKDGLKAWHASPHVIDKFDIGKVGTGEGSQAFGHGLYFADDPSTIEWYKQLFEKRGLDGHRYETRLDVAPSDLADLNKPLAAQPRKIQDAFSDLYQMPRKTLLQGQKPQPLGAAESHALAEHGVPGAVYDAGSFWGGNNPNARNYVMFDDKPISILRRYAVPGAIGLGAGATATGLMAHHDQADASPLSELGGALRRSRLAALSHTGELPFTHGDAGAVTGALATTGAGIGGILGMQPVFQQQARDAEADEWADKLSGETKALRSRLDAPGPSPFNGGAWRPAYGERPGVPGGYAPGETDSGLAPASAQGGPFLKGIKNAIAPASFTGKGVRALFGLGAKAAETEAPRVIDPLVQSSWDRDNAALNAPGRFSAARGDNPTRMGAPMAGKFDGVDPKKLLSTALLGAGVAGAATAGGQGEADAMNIGPLAKTWDHALGAKAAEMFKSGVPQRQIFKDTGLFRDAGGNWGKEIDDTPMSVTPGYGRLGDLVHHPELFDAYPQLADKVAKIEESRGTGGGYWQKSGNATEYPGGPPHHFYVEPTSGWHGQERSAKSPMAHEIQHAVDDEEGRSYGTHKDLFDFGMPTQNYDHTIGEVRARNVQTRLNMTPEERLASYPGDTEDVPWYNQILRERPEITPSLGDRLSKALKGYAVPGAIGLGAGAAVYTAGGQGQSEAATIDAGLAQWARAHPSDYQDAINPPEIDTRRGLGATLHDASGAIIRRLDDLGSSVASDPIGALKGAGRGLMAFGGDLARGDPWSWQSLVDPTGGLAEEANSAAPFPTIRTVHDDPLALALAQRRNRK